MYHTVIIAEISPSVAADNAGEEIISDGAEGIVEQQLNLSRLQQRYYIQMSGMIN